MSIPRNDQLKSAIVARLKSNATILVLLDDANEIREAQWQGTEFSYPNIRVRVIENKPNQANCNFTDIKFGVACFSEDDSSQEADKMAGIIGNQLHTQSFASEGIKFTNILVESLVPAIRIERIWISETILNGTANG